MVSIQPCGFRSLGMARAYVAIAVVDLEPEHEAEVTGAMADAAGWADSWACRPGVPALAGSTLALGDGDHCRAATDDDQAREQQREMDEGELGIHRENGGARQRGG